MVVIAIIAAALFSRHSPSTSTDSRVRDVAGSPSGAAAPALPAAPASVPAPTARSSVPAAKPSSPAEPSRSSVRLTKAWKTVSLGAGGERASVSFEGKGPFRIRAGRKLYVVNGSTPVELDLRGLSEVDLRAVADPTTVDIVSARNRSLVGN
ncbi:hypothetical protein ASG54_14475 [Aureimonas sp. Leaf460]|nr:hypothetical protein ASG62_01745 [Aureimonas sp. Leaf427]KQT75993.1 hypothetical protein ASG54_14475 [Aureimonas sp. Leaf460]